MNPSRHYAGFLKFCIWFNNVLPKKSPQQIFDLIIGLPGISKKSFTIFCIIFLLHKFEELTGSNFLKFCLWFNDVLS